MKRIKIKSAVISASIIWVLGVSAFLSSYFVPVISDPNLQANLVLSIALIPSALFGAHLYYRKSPKTNGFVLGTFMLLLAMLLDAVFTVPFLIMPYGGNYITFFTDPFFWMIALEYVSIVAAYWQIERAIQGKRFAKS